MTNNISEYDYIVHKLAPFVEKPEFSRMLNDATKGFGNESRFLLKMEMKRLCKPCIRSIDLRTQFGSHIELVSYQGIKHYLHEPAVKLFEELVERYGEYTFGVYESVLKLAENESNQNAAITNNNNNDLVTERQSQLEQFIVNRQALLAYPHRNEERMNYAVAVEVFLETNTSLFATTVDISLSGLKIKLKEYDKAHLINALTSVRIIFRGFPGDSKLTKESIEYRVLEVVRDAEQVKVHLMRDAKLGLSMFNSYVKKLIKTNKRRYKVNVDNVMESLGDKVHELAFASSNPSLSVFVDTKNPQAPLAKYACINGINKEIMDYWLDEDDEQNLGFLINSDRINALIENASQEACIWLYAFTHIKDGKVYFYSASNQELAAIPDLRAVFLSYASRKASWRVYKMTCHEVNPKSAFTPTALPDGINRKIDQLNRPLSPRLESTLQNVQHMLSITDITHLVAQQCYQKNALDRDKIKQLAAFGHPRNKLPHAVLPFRYKQQDLRKETRYKLRTSIRLENYDTIIMGTSEDCSVSGLKIELDLPFEQRINSKVSISFPHLQKKTNQFVLEDLNYRVKHINYDKLVLHLEAISEEELSVAEEFFTLLINNNKDKLKAVSNEESVPGMGFALRCIQAKNTSQVCTYMYKKNSHFFPIATTVQDSKAPWLSLFTHDMPASKINNTWLFQDKHKANPFIRDALQTLKVDPRPIQAEIYIAFDPSDLDYKTAIVAQWDSELATHRSKMEFIKSACSQGKFFAFHVHISRASKAEATFLEHELAYLAQYAIHKAKQVEEQMLNMAGQIFLTDITDETLYRYQIEI